MRQPRLKKDLLYSAEKKEFLAECRKSLKESMGKLAAEYDLGTEEQMEADLAGCAAPMEELLTLAEKFRESYGQQRKNGISWTFRMWPMQLWKSSQ